MKAKSILFPTDFSENSEIALLHASSLARDSGAKILIVHVHDPSMKIADTGFAGYPLAENEDTQRELQTMLETVTPPYPAVPYSHRLVHGIPAEEIVRLAKMENTDIIVMGSHGRRGVSRLLMGSVAEAVVRRAPCPVLTVKQPAEELSGA